MHRARISPSNLAALFRYDREEHQACAHCWIPTHPSRFVDAFLSNTNACAHRDALAEDFDRAPVLPLQGGVLEPPRPTPNLITVIIPGSRPHWIFG